MAQLATLASQMAHHLSSKYWTPSETWMNAFLATQKPTTALSSLKHTAQFRFLNSDITSSMQVTSSSVFPDDILVGTIVERRLPGPIPVQVLDIEDIGNPRWGQIDDIESEERGEKTSRFEIIRMVPGEENSSNPAPASGGPHILLLQDAKGIKVYGFEMSDMEKINLRMSIGTKLILKNALVARSVVMLDEGSATVLGGKLESLQTAWKEGRKAALRSSIDSSNDR